MDWQSLGNGWRRGTVVRPGYDWRTRCPRRRRTTSRRRKHTPKGDHGICAEKWFYVVSDGECALVLVVSSGRYPESAAGHNQPAEGYDLTLHVPWPTDEASIREGASGSPCDFTETGRCWIAYSTALGAHEFWKVHGVDAFEQPDSFWEALREKAEEWIRDTKQDRECLLHLRQCPVCEGRGVVEE